MKIGLKVFFGFVTGVCVGLVLGILVGTNWEIMITFGHPTVPVVNGAPRTDLQQAIRYFVQITDADTGDTVSYHNNRVLDSIEMESPYRTSPIAPPAPPPPGSENDPNYQAEIVKQKDGTLLILPAPAFRKNPKPNPNP